MQTVVTVADTFITSKREGRCLPDNIHPNYLNRIKFTLVKDGTRRKDPLAFLEDVEPVIQFDF